jgi:hypothetical protein
MLLLLLLLVLLLLILLSRLRLCSQEGSDNVNCSSCNGSLVLLGLLLEPALLASMQAVAAGSPHS